jgi:hypothetical protein
MRLVRSNRSNPALKQALAKARFFKKEYYPDEKDSARSQVVGGDCFLKTCGQPHPALAREGADLAFGKDCQDIRD